MKIVNVDRKIFACNQDYRNNSRNNSSIKRSDYKKDGEQLYGCNTGLNTPTFNGGADTAFNVLDKLFKILDKNAMIQVSFVDTVSTNIPRTVVDLGTGLAAAFETCRREFSGLFVNCLMPGLVVKGIAKLLPKSKEIKGTNVVSSWANSDSINKLSEIYKQSQSSGAENTVKDYVKNALSSIEGLDGKNWVSYAQNSEKPEFKEAIEKITIAITDKKADKKTLLKEAREGIANLTKAENILRFNGQKQSNLEETIRDIADLGTKFETVKNNVIKNGGDNAKISQSIDNYAKGLKKFVNQKSLIGLGIVIAIAMSVQTINRSITRKQFNAEGAPIYKEFGKQDTTQKMDEKQKKEFKVKKLLAAAGMYGLAGASMMKKPSLGMFQFSGIFPSLDQCRWIAASTFASRMMGAEDTNELRETTVRDIASFAGLYFLGDYVKKAAASAIEALSKTKKGAKITGENVILLNRSKEVQKPIVELGSSKFTQVLQQGQYRVKQLGNWVKNTELKTAAEVSGTKVRNLRNICRVADIAFSIIMLGFLLPKYNRKVTEKKVAQAKALEQQKSNSVISEKNIPEVFKELKTIV